MTPVQDLNNLYFFAKVVDFGSYTAAAKALGLQTSKLSRRIAALETELGVRLINRTTRRLSLTEAGKTFHRHCLALLDEAQAAKDAMSQILASPPHGRSLHAAVCGAARDWCSPSPASPRCERFGGRRAHTTAAVAQGSRRNRARCFPVAARNGSRGARAPRLALRGCPPAPELT